MKRFTALLLSLLLITGLLSALPITAAGEGENVAYVGLGEGEYDNLQKAHDALAAAGVTTGTIYVREGRYATSDESKQNGAVRFGFDVTIEAAPGVQSMPTLYAAENTDSGIYTQVNNPLGVNITIRGLIIENYYRSVMFNALTLGIDTFDIQDCVINTDRKVFDGNASGPESLQNKLIFVNNTVNTTAGDVLQGFGNGSIIKDCVFNLDSAGCSLTSGTLNGGSLVFTGNIVRCTQEGASAERGLALHRSKLTAADMTVEKNVFINVDEDIRVKSSEITGELDLSMNYSIDSGAVSAPLVKDTATVPVENSYNVYPFYVNEAMTMWENEDGSRESGAVVEMKVDPSYTVIIPESVDFGALAWNAEGYAIKPGFTVAVKDAFIDSGAAIEVRVTSDFTFNGASDIGYELYTNAVNAEATSGGAKLNTGELYCSFGYDGTVTPINTESFSARVYGYLRCKLDQIKYAGSYSDLMTFTITYKTTAP